MSFPYALHHNRAVLASAGTGKTHALVETYVGLLVGLSPREPLPPQSILALTFTDRAASEMRARVLSRLAQLSTEGPARDAWLDAVAGQATITAQDALAQLQPAVLAAPIGTFHAFCARLLHEHAALAGHGLGATVLDDAQARTLLHESALEAVTQQLETDARHDMLALLQDLGSTAQWGLLAQLVTLRLGLGEHGVPLESITPLVLPSHTFETARVDVPAVVRAAGLAGFTTPAARDKAGQLLTLAQQVERAADDDALLNALAAMHALASANWGGPAATPARTAIKDATALAVSGWAAREGLLAAQRFKELLLAVERAYTARKTDLGVLDFQDLLLGARTLLAQHPAVRARLLERHQAVLVDEMQDTSPLQAQLLAQLLDQNPGEARALHEIELSPGRLLVVGDRKQSIYGFRGADVNLLDQARAAVERSGGNTVFLDASRRSARTLVGLLNRLGQAALQEDWRAEDTLTTVREGGAAAPGTWVRVTVPDGSTQDDARLLEARALARHLAGRINAGARAQDLVVLLRKRTHAHVYHAALEACGVPARVGRGGDLLSRSEVLDAVALWAILLDPTDAHALATLLRSPWVLLRDEILVALAFSGEHHGLDAHALLRDGVPPGVDALMTPMERTSLAALRTLWERLSPNAATAQAGALLQQALDALDAWAIVELAPDGAARAANLRALELLVAGRNTAEALHLVRECQRAGLGVPLGMPETQGQVAILTIHEAKGLEWPVVALADLASGAGGAPGAAAWHPAHGLAVRVVDHASGALKQTRANHPLRVVTNARNVDADNETRRLLYVALTRARDELVLSGAPPTGRPVDVDTFLGRLGPALEAEVAQGTVNVVLDPAPAQVAVAPPVLPTEPAAAAPPPPARTAPAAAPGKRRGAAAAPGQLSLLLDDVAPPPTQPAGGLRVVLTLDECVSRRHPGLALATFQPAPLAVPHSRWGQAVPGGGTGAAAAFWVHPLAKALSLVPTTSVEENVVFAFTTAQGVVTGALPWVARGDAGQPWTLLDVVEGGTAETRRGRLQLLVEALRAGVGAVPVRAVQCVLEDAPAFEVVDHPAP